MAAPSKLAAAAAPVTRPWERAWESAPKRVPVQASPRWQGPGSSPWQGPGSSPSNSSTAPQATGDKRALTFKLPDGRGGTLAGGMPNMHLLRDMASKSWGVADDNNPLAKLQHQDSTFSSLGAEHMPNRLSLYSDGPGPEELPTPETLQKRAELEVVVEGSAAYPVDFFHEAEGIPEYALQAIANMGILTPLPIQAQALPIALAGRDLVGVARTGSGKTIAFLLPCIVHLEALGVLSRRGYSHIVAPNALVLAPTRELAIQIADAAKLLCQGSDGPGRGAGLQTCVVYGGGSKNDQVNEMRYGCNILVATPGRLTDLLAAGTVSLDSVTYFVLDEADRMMDHGFAAEVNEYSRRIRPDRQMLFFSATWPQEVQDLARNLCHSGQTPVRLKVGQAADGGVATRADIFQEVIVFDQATWEERDLAKQLVLYEHLRQVLQFAEAKVLVFVSRKTLADEMKQRLAQEGFFTEAMHGGRPQQERLSVLERFRCGEVKLLVATDVMGRGLDIPDVTHVVLYDMSEVEEYVHRIGRTCRGPDGQAGHALTFFEYERRKPMLAAELIKVLEESGQGVPEDLAGMAIQVEQGAREKLGAAVKRKADWSSSDWSSSDWSSSSWQGGGGGGGWKGQGGGRGMAAAVEEETLEVALQKATMEFFRQKLLRGRTA